MSGMPDTGSFPKTSNKKLLSQAAFCKKITVSETCGIERYGEVVSVGIPFAKGELTSIQGVVLVQPSGESQPVQVTVLNNWQDGSVKWALFDFVAAVGAGICAEYRLVNTSGQLPIVTTPVVVRKGTESWQVDTGKALFTIDAKIFRPFSSVKTKSGERCPVGSISCSLVDDAAQNMIPTVETITLETEGPLRSTLRLAGYFSTGSDAIYRFLCRLHFYADSTYTLMEFTLHNPRAAKHPGGLWDLGDPGSLFFKELAFQLELVPSTVTENVYTLEPGGEAITYPASSGTVGIYQESSGGENWQSATHRNRVGAVPFTIKGYKVTAGNADVNYGERATPSVWCGNGATGVAVVIPKFWQEFPKAIKADQGNLKIALFPADFPDLHELQGGEQSTTSLYVDFAAAPTALDWARSPLCVIAAPAVYCCSTAISGMSPSLLSDTPATMVDQYVPDPGVLLGRRETIDEYGWRNFGEVYADHEALYHRGKDKFVSHYNNQYDLCAGFYHKFLGSGNPQWGELAADLARHILDIDIYHTDMDREEYNQGLFWHTDHYIAAGLATHRSFSREHLKTKNPRVCGGGPGAQHCYTSGLTLHYFMTGNPDYKNAVIQLAEWCYRSIKGSQTVLAAIKNAGRYLALLRSASQNTQTAFPQYPLGRGTGNAINACLDALELTDDRLFLKRAEELVRGSIHPADNMDARDLSNVETSWSYTVLLAAVGRLLCKLEELEEFREVHAYAKACLLSYAEWMLKNEYPYLEHPEVLEYPNETWPAQDLRKCVVFYYAARYADNGRREAFLNKSRFFYKASVDELSRHPTREFTRPVALMLQSRWIGPALERLPAAGQGAVENRHYFTTPPTPYLCISQVTARIAGELFQAARTSCFGREINWLRLRYR